MHLEVSDRNPASSPSASVGEEIPTLIPMKTPSTSLFVHLFSGCRLGLALIFLTLSQAFAQVDATAWTSVDGTTIWARLDGMKGDQVILYLRGKTYHVPLSRLSPRSVEKVAQMLQLEDAKAKVIAAIPRPAPEASPTEATPTDSAEATGRMLEVEATVNSPTPQVEVVLEDSPDDRPALVVTPPVNPPPASPAGARGSRMHVDGRRAVAPAGLLAAVLTAVEAGNRLQRMFWDQNAAIPCRRKASFK
jgi:hypothetical protein